MLLSYHFTDRLELRNILKLIQFNYFSYDVIQLNSKPITIRLHFYFFIIWIQYDVIELISNS